MHSYTPPKDKEIPAIIREHRGSDQDLKIDKDWNIDDQEHIEVSPSASVRGAGSSWLDN